MYLYGLVDWRLANRAEWHLFLADFVGAPHAEEVVAARNEGSYDLVVEADDAVVFAPRLRWGTGGGAAAGRGVAVGAVGERRDVYGKPCLVCA